MPVQLNSVQANAALLEAGIQGLHTGGSEAIHGVSDRNVRGTREAAIQQLRQVLIDSQRVFLHDGAVVFEARSARDGNRLVPILTGDRITPSATAFLAELADGAVMGSSGLTTFQLPGKLVAEVLVHPQTLDNMPRIDWYGRRPAFSLTFETLGPGYHVESRSLIHGSPAVPAQPWVPQANVPALDRLPPHLRRLLKDFCFSEPADLANAVAALLSGLLMNHLVSAGKPPFLVDANQKSLGKTLLATIIALILDGVEPPLIHDTPDEDELGKRLGSAIRPGQASTVLLFDNRKGTIGGNLLESLALAPRVNVRELGRNADLSRQNNLLWMFTANNATATADMTSRFVVIRLRYEGDPKEKFAVTNVEEQSLKQYAREHRAEIFGELMGMVERWREAGSPLGARRHRCTHWSNMIGGVLTVAGFGDAFLANQDAVVAELDQELDDLAALAEIAIRRSSSPGFVVVTGLLPVQNGAGRRAADWSPLFQEARVCQAAYAYGASERSRATAIGRFFSSRIGRPVPVLCGNATGVAVLRAQSERLLTAD